MKRYGKGLLVLIKEEEVFKIIINKAFTDDEVSPFEKIEPYKKFNTQWETVYSRDLAEFIKEEKIEMCPKNIVDIRVPRRDHDSRLIGPPIIELEFEKDTLYPSIIIGGENNQLQIKKEKPTCEKCLQYRHPKSSAEATGNFAEPLQEDKST